MSRMTPLLAVLLVPLAAAAAAAQDVTDLRPLVVERPTNDAPPRFRLGVTVDISARGMLVKSVEPNSPMRKMRNASRPDALFEAEPGDTIIGIKDGSGRFILPNSGPATAAVLNSLAGTRTQVIVGDVNGSGNKIYTIDFGASGCAGGGPRPPDGPGKVVVVLIGDTNDDKVGKAVAGAFAGLREVLKEKEIKPHVREVHEISGREFDRRTILTRLNAIPVGANDALLCFVNAHGAHDPNRRDYCRGHFFAMPAGGDFRRSDLRDALNLKGARLTCLLSDSCNAPAEFTSQRPVQALEAPSNPKFESLFLKAAGVVDLNSSSPGQYAFTYVFAPLLADSLSINGTTRLPFHKETTWKEYAEELVAETGALYKDARTQMLRNPRISDTTRKILEGQPAQTVVVYDLKAR